MKFENTEVFNLDGAIRGMRNPYDSWDKSDSLKGNTGKGYCVFVIGKNDMELAQRLIKGGSEHRKFLRQILVSVDITAPFYWWKEFDTYKVGTTSNSCSTMHTLSKYPITRDMFEMDDFHEVVMNDEFSLFTVNMVWDNLIDNLESLRQKYLRTKEKKYWKELVRLLPESWLQKRTITMNYENLLSMCRQRENHKLSEWNSFIKWVKEDVPYAEDLIFFK